MDIVKLEEEIRKSNQSFCDEVRGMTLQQIKERLAQESLEVQRINIYIENNDDIKRLKEELKTAKDRLDEVMKPSKDSLKKQNNKIKFLLVNLEEKTIE